MTEMTAEQVFGEYSAQPPLVRPQFAKKYVGVEVDWPVRFADAWEAGKKIRVAFHLETPAIRGISGNVPRARYPQLEHLHAREPLRIRGRIRSVSTLWIELDITELLFCLEVAEVAR